ncbi:MAG TPA: 50S ribosomal protein L15, partial [Candidatus Peregrinibacteria bacterium]|nr:50S ribosomal protein L15 [Candidatus Peregrinibacteria bacterium]
MRLNALEKISGKSKRRRGRGDGSGRGSFSGRGMKGQRARAGKKLRPSFEGGQTPLFQRLPKLKGFKNPNRVPY